MRSRNRDGDYDVHLVGPVEDKGRAARSAITNLVYAGISFAISTHFAATAIKACPECVSALMQSPLHGWLTWLLSLILFI